MVNESGTPPEEGGAAKLHRVKEIYLQAVPTEDRDGDGGDDGIPVSAPRSEGGPTLKLVGDAGALDISLAEEKQPETPPPAQETARVPSKSGEKVEKKGTSGHCTQCTVDVPHGEKCPNCKCLIS